MNFCIFFSLFFSFFKTKIGKGNDEIKREEITKLTIYAFLKMTWKCHLFIRYSLFSIISSHFFYFIVIKKEKYKYIYAYIKKIKEKG